MGYCRRLWWCWILEALRWTLLRVREVRTSLVGVRAALSVLVRSLLSMKPYEKYRSFCNNLLGEVILTAARHIKRLRQNMLVWVFLCWLNIQRLDFVKFSFCQDDQLLVVMSRQHVVSTEEYLLFVVDRALRGIQKWICREIRYFRVHHALSCWWFHVLLLPSGDFIQDWSLPTIGVIHYMRVNILASPSTSTSTNWATVFLEFQR